MKRVQLNWDTITTFHINKEGYRENEEHFSIKEAQAEFWEAVYIILSQKDKDYLLTMYDSERNEFI